MTPNYHINSTILKFQLALLLLQVNIADSDALNSVFVGISYMHLIIMILVFFSFRTNHLFKVAYTQGLFEVFILLALTVSIIKFDTGGINLVFVDFLILYYLMYSQKPGEIELSYINKLYLLQVSYGILVGILGLGDIGYLPFLGNNASYDWRISMFPGGQTPVSGAFSLIVLILNSYLPSRPNKVVIGISVMYLFFSGSRTTLMCLAFIAILLLINRFLPNLSAAKQILLAYLLPVGSLLFLFLTILSFAQSNVFIMELLFRNFADKEATIENFDRFLIMRAYWEQFVLNPLLGKSTALEFNEFADLGLNDVKTRGSETKLLMHLANFGVSYFLFAVTIFREKIACWKVKNKSTTIIWIFFFVSYLFYGSYMTGYSFIGFLVILIVSNRITHQDIVDSIETDA